MKSGLTWPEILRSRRFKGLWVAIDNCRYDASTLQPIEGDVVDADEDLTELCRRMREKGLSSCSVFFCEDDVLVEPARPSAVPSERRPLPR